jgi:hypothetical protein
MLSSLLSHMHLISLPLFDRLYSKWIQHHKLHKMITPMLVERHTNRHMYIVDLPNLGVNLHHILIFEWNVVWCDSKNGYQKYMD